MPTASNRVKDTKINFKGMDSTTRPHLLDDDMVVQAVNMRTNKTSFLQVPGFVYPVDSGNLASSYGEAIVALPVNQVGSASIVGIGRKAGYLLNLAAVASSSRLLFDGATTDFGLDGSHTYGEARWMMTKYNSQVWLINPIDGLLVMDGTKFTTINAAVKARYIDAFYDHAVVANQYYNGEDCPWRISWSDLYNFAQHTPAQENEADFFDAVEWDNPNLPFCGITGLRRLGNLVLAYTPSCILRVEYVGLPKVMQVNPVKEGIGNCLYYGLASNGKSHFFFDCNEFDFFQFDESGLKSIGGPVISEMESMADTLGFAGLNVCHVDVRPEFSEVAWLFEGMSPKVALVYSWAAQAWHKETFSGVWPCGQSLQAAAEQAMSIDGLTGTQCDSLNPGPFFKTINGLASSGLSLGTSWLATSSIPGGENTNMKLVRYERSTDADVDVITADSPYVETKDFIYGDIQSWKEVDALVLQSTYTSGTGIKVEIAVRENLDDVLAWVDVGTWTPTIKEKMLTFKAVVGRVFRYRFTLLGTHPRGWLLSAMEPRVYNMGALR